MPTLVKFLYCPKCKDLRPKAWFSISDTCISCRGPARAIPIPRTPVTYAKYVLWIVVLAMIALHLKLDDRMFLWAGVVVLAAGMVLAYVDLLRGERKARARIRMTAADLEALRERKRV